MKTEGSVNWIDQRGSVQVSLFYENDRCRDVIFIGSLAVSYDDRWAEGRTWTRILYVAPLLGIRHPFDVVSDLDSLSSFYFQDAWDYS